MDILMLMLILLIILLVFRYITLCSNEAFSTLNYNSCKVIKPGYGKFNFYEYEFDFTNYLTNTNNYLILAKCNLANLGHLYSEGVAMILCDDIIYCKNNIGQWQYLSRDNPYELYFWEPVIDKLDNKKLDSML